jgi:hypothetical protein
MQLGFLKNNKRWYIDKRYSEFDALDKSIKDFYPSMPTLPGKTLFKLSDEKYIEDRRQAINSYMKTLINRRDMRSCPQFRKFIELDSNFPQS